MMILFTAHTNGNLVFRQYCHGDSADAAHQQVLEATQQAYTYIYDTFPASQIKQITLSAKEVVHENTSNWMELPR